MTGVLWPTSAPDHIREAWQGSPLDLVHHRLWGAASARAGVCFGEDLSATQVISLVQQSSVFSLVQDNPEWCGDDLRAALRMRTHPEEYMKQPGDVLLNGADEIWQWSFSERSEKQDLKERLLLRCLAASDSCRESLGFIFEELFMNAVLDAPREFRQGEGAFAHPQAPSRMILTRRGNRVCLSCTDPYGTLKIEKFIGRMSEVYKQGAGQVVNLHAERGGAGLGCVILFEQSSVLALGVQKGVQTTVSCVVPLNLNHRQRASVKKALHLVQIDHGGEE